MLPTVAAPPPPPIIAAYHAPRTPDGQPNLQGIWTNATRTPLQRRSEFKDLVATPAEEADFLGDGPEPPAGAPAKPKPAAAEPPMPNVGESEWFERPPGLMRIDGKARSSLITEPADGKLPYNLIGKNAVKDVMRRDEQVFDGPEDRVGDERCLMAVSSASTPPMLPAPYNAHYLIIQTPGRVTINAEMIHDVRTVRLGGAHEAGPPQWLGDSIGRWEGETLVVETVGQHAVTADRFATGGILHITPATKVTERFTRTSPTVIRYVFTVEDASIYTQPWKGEMLFTASSAPMYEYACHEGNYALANILRGARKKDQDEAAKAAAQKGVETKKAPP